MPSRAKRMQGRKAYIGGKISEGKIPHSLRGYKPIGRRVRVGRREIDWLMKRGNTIAHIETTKENGKRR